EGISDLITTPGIINVDFADIKAIMKDAGSALMGIGTASGEQRAEKAAIAAINSPLLEVSIHGAKGVLFAISGGEDLTIHEIQEAAKVITESIDKDAKVIFGTIRDEKLKKGEVKVTVIATNFPADMPRKTLFSNAPVGNQTLVKEETAPMVKKEVDATINMVKNTPPASTPVSNMNNMATNDFIKKVETAKKPEPIKDIIIDDDTDDWSAVPAFLRRKK
ncbi:MAG: cell division protein FtsZ, partial [bacterium]